MERLEINAKRFLGITNTIKERMRVLINYKFTHKKLKLTQKVNNVHHFQFTVCPLFNSLFGGNVFSIIIIIIIIIIIKKLSLDCREF